MRVEDLQRIAQNQITNNTLIYVSNNGLPYSSTIVDVASQVSGVTGSYVINSQLSGLSGVLSSQISGLNASTNNMVYTTGNQIISGNKTFAASLLDQNGVPALTTNSRQLYNSNSNGVLDWNARTLNNPGVQAVNWSGYTMKDSSNLLSMSWDNRQLLDNSSAISSDWQFRYLYDTSSIVSLNWSTRNLNDSAGNQSIDWNGRNLIGNWNINSSGIVNTITLQNTGQNLNSNIQITGQALYRYVTGLSGLVSPSHLVYNSGNQTVSGIKTFANNLNYNTIIGSSIQADTIQGTGSNFSRIDFRTNRMTDVSFIPSLNWGSRFLADSSAITCLDWDARQLLDNSNALSLRWNDRQLLDNSNILSLHWAQRALQDDSASPSIDWSNRRLIDSNTNFSLEYQNRILYDTDGSTISIDWKNRILSGFWNSDNLNLSGNLVATANNLQSTGSILYNLINASSAGVSSINGQSGILTLTGIGTISVVSNGQTIIISGNNSGNFATVANLQTTGQTNYNLITGLSGQIQDDLQRVIKSQKISFKTTGIYNLYTVPSNYLFAIDTMEVITSNISSPSAAPYIEFGNTSSLNAYQILTQTTSNSQFSRHIFSNPQDTINAGTILTASIITASTATFHSGFLIIKGYLINNL